MKCPLKFKIEDMWGEKQRIYSGDCLKEECAWWDERKLCCGERTKRIQLERIADALEKISNNMPRTFREP